MTYGILAIIKPHNYNTTIQAIQMAHITISNSILSYYTVYLDKIHKKLSYRRETARQLPTWRGAKPLQPTPPPPTVATPMRMVEFETRNKRTSSVPSIKHILS